jgi:predicted O-methyltransferase YrrM
MIQVLLDQLLAFVPREQAALDSGETEGRPEYPDGLYMGGKYKPERLLLAAEWSLRRYAGDMVEIGVLGGGTTVKLARLAAQYGRRVIAVDPWVPGQGGCAETTRQEFTGRTWKYRALIDVVHDYSQSEAAVRYIKARPLCFAYIDGAHYYEPCSTDIETVSHCAGVIVLDDLWMEGVLRAFGEAGQRPDREAFSHRILAEGYLLPVLHVERG